MSSVAPNAAQSAPGRMLNLRLESKPIIYASYMSFLEYGGVFLPTTDTFEMHEEVLLVLELVSNKIDKLFVKTKVCWINAHPSSGGRSRGIGLAFTDDEQSIKAKVLLSSWDTRYAIYATLPMRVTSPTIAM